MRSALIFVAGLLLLPVLLLIGAFLGMLPVDAVATPPRLEALIGGAALDASLERKAKGLHNPVAAADAESLAAGMTVYRENCAGCHGGARGPSKWGAGNFYPRVPQFWQDPVHVSPEEAFVVVRDGIRYSGMAAWRGMISPEEMWQVANFVSRMHALPPAVDAQWKAGPAD